MKMEGYTLSYEEVPIMCKITDDAPGEENITNIADITEYQDEEKKPVIDRDSEEDNVDLPEDKDLPGYKDEEEGEYIPGQEDDDDFEKVFVEVEGQYNLQLIKVDKENNNKLQGATFKITLPEGEEKELTTNEEGTVRIEGIEITAPGIDTIKVEEITAPSGYNKLFDSFEIDVTKEENNGNFVVTNVELKNQQGNGAETESIQVENTDGMITITVPNEKKYF